MTTSLTIEAQESPKRDFPKPPKRVVGNTKAEDILLTLTLISFLIACAAVAYIFLMAELTSGTHASPAGPTVLKVSLIALFLSGIAYWWRSEWESVKRDAAWRTAQAELRSYEFPCTCRVKKQFGRVSVSVKVYLPGDCSNTFYLDMRHGALFHSVCRRPKDFTRAVLPKAEWDVFTDGEIEHVEAGCEVIPINPTQREPIEAEE